MEEGAKTYEALWEEYDGEHWHAEYGKVQANDIQEAIRLIVANYFMGQEIVKVRGFSINDLDCSRFRYSDSNLS